MKADQVEREAEMENYSETRDSPLDLRESGESAGRSINLALSERGRTALRLAGAEIETEVLDLTWGRTHAHAEP